MAACGCGARSRSSCASVGAGYLFDLMAAKDLILLIIGARLCDRARRRSRFRRSRRMPEESEADVTATHLLRQHGFVAILLAASLIQGSHSLYYGFSTISWKAAGIDGVTIGLLWACGVVLRNRPVRACRRRLPPAIGPLTLMLIGATLATFRWIAMAFDPPGCYPAGVAGDARHLLRRDASRHHRTISPMPRRKISAPPRRAISMS